MQTWVTVRPIRLDVDPLAASPLPINLGLVKQHLAVDFTDLDELIETYILAAITAFEDTTHRTVIRRTHRWVIEDFPQTIYQHIRLPRGKTRSIEKIEIIQDGATVSLLGPSSGSPAGTGYQEDLRGDDGGLVMPPRAGSWPSVDLDNPSPVTIHFTAGWDTAELPANVLNAILFGVRVSLDDLRGSVDPGKHMANQQTWEALVSGYRLTRWY